MDSYKKFVCSISPNLTSIWGGSWMMNYSGFRIDAPHFVLGVAGIAAVSLGVIALLVNIKEVCQG